MNKYNNNLSNIIDITDMTTNHFSYSIMDGNANSMNSSDVSLKTISMYMTAAGFTYQFGLNISTKIATDNTSNLPIIKTSILHMLNTIISQLTELKNGDIKLVTFGAEIPDVLIYNTFVVTKQKSAYKITFQYGSEDIVLTDVDNLISMFKNMINDVTIMIV
jgi:hypothetical protein